MTKVMLTW